MAMAEFFLPEARRRVGQTVESIESGTSAEIVVAVRRRSGHYRQTDLYAGGALGLLTLAFMLFDTHAFDVDWMPVNVAVAFALGALGCANVQPLRRWLTSPRILRESSRVASRAAFYDMGISRTTGRTGVLVFISMFERRVEVVPDIAVKPDELGAAWTSAVAALEASVAGTPDLGEFLAALALLAPPLARALPIQADDVNELPNEPVVA